MKRVGLTLPLLESPVDFLMVAIEWRASSTWNSDGAQGVVGVSVVGPVDCTVTAPSGSLGILIGTIAFILVCSSPIVQLLLPGSEGG